MAGFRSIPISLSDFFSLSPDLMCVATPEGRLLACNPAFVRTYGFSEPELEAMNYLVTIHPDDMEYFTAELALVAAGQPRTGITFRSLHKDGSYIKSEWSVRLRDGLMFCSGRDITEQSRHMQLIAEAHQRHETLARLAPVGIFLADSQGQVIFVNEALASFLGMTVEQALGSGWAESLHPEDAERVGAAWQACVNEGVPYRLTCRYRMPDGRDRWVEARADRMLNPDGSVSGFTGVIIDITERVEHEAELQAARARYETLARVAPVGIYMSDAEGNGVFTNKRLEEISGYSAEESRGQGYLQSIHPDDVGEMMRGWSDAVTQSKTFVGEHRMLTKTGAVRWVRHTAEALPGPDGRIAGSVGIIDDVTERHERQRMLAMAGSIAKVGAWEVDAATGKPRLSLELLHILEADDNFDPSLDDALVMYPEDFRDTVRQQVQEAIENGTPFDFESEFRTFRGNLRWAHVVGEAEMVNGRCVRVVGVLQDVTDRMLAQQAQRAASEKLRLLFERAPLGILLHRMDGQYIQCNAAFRRIMGWNGQDVRSLNHFDFVPEDQAEAEDTKMQLLMQGGSYGPVRSTIRREDGSVVPVVSNGVLVTDELGEEFVWGIVEDISLQQELEQTRQQHEQQLEAANLMLADTNRELEEFTYAASHDLREPLRTIASFCELLEEDLTQGNTDAAHEDMRVVKQAAQRMNNLVRDLLDLSRSGKQDLRLETVRLDSLARHAIQNLQAGIQASGATIEIEDLPVVTGDVLLLERVFQNLIGNAIKYQPAGAKPQVRVSAERDGEFWQIRVKDNGIGIEARYHEQIFGAFKRLHGQSKYEGSGIGLAIVKKTIERHGGSISVESAPGEGSTFIIALPGTAEVTMESAR